MASLAESIKLAKVAVVDGDQIIIDRTILESRKRKLKSSVPENDEPQQKSNTTSRVSTSSSTGGPKGSSGAHNNDSIDWKEKYLALRNEKMEEIDDILLKIELSSQREKKIEQYANLLEKKVELLSNKLATASSSSSDIADSSKVSNNAEDIIRFFELMTSMIVKRDEENPHYFVCTVQNLVNRTATKFAIDTKDREKNSDVRFTPIANSNLLPEYLRGEISFEPNMAPVLTGDVLQALYADPQTE